MSEEATMVVPRSWNYVHDKDDPYLRYDSDPSVLFKHYYKYVKEDKVSSVSIYKAPETALSEKETDSLLVQKRCCAGAL